LVILIGHLATKTLPTVPIGSASTYSSKQSLIRAESARPARGLARAY
jgi:hypothetical protein